MYSSCRHVTHQSTVLAPPSPTCPAGALQLCQPVGLHLLLLLLLPVPALLLLLLVEDGGGRSKVSSSRQQSARKAASWRDSCSMDILAAVAARWIQTR